MRLCRLRESECLQPECSRTRCMEEDVREEHAAEEALAEALDRLLDACVRIPALRRLVKDYDDAAERRRKTMEKHLRV